MSKQFEQLEILYKQILATSLEIKSLIDREMYDEAVFKEAHKSQLISKVAFLKKQLVFSESEKEIIEKYREEIKTQENENMEKLESLRSDVLIKLKASQAKEKVNNVYDQIEPESGTIIDYTSD
ncbi:MAG: hypothetical protein ACI37S_06635 [Candidatus Gastranaerophilaceae bacterium]